MEPLTIDLTPEWVNVAKHMARVLRWGEFPTEQAKYEFSSQYGEILAYLKRTNPEGWKEVTSFANKISDQKEFDNE